MPVYPYGDGQEKTNYTIDSHFDKITADWLRMSIPDLDNLDYLYYLKMRRDAFIDRLNQSEEGRKYLDNAYRLTLTEPDREASRELFGGGNNGKD